MGKKKGGGGGGAPPPPPKGGTPKTDNDADEVGDPDLGGLYEDELDITIATISFLVKLLGAEILCYIPNVCYIFCNTNPCESLVAWR